MGKVRGESKGVWVEDRSTKYIEETCLQLQNCKPFSLAGWAQFNTDTLNQGQRVQEECQVLAYSN